MTLEEAMRAWVSHALIARDAMRDAAKILERDAPALAGLADELDRDITARVRVVEAVLNTLRSQETDYDTRNRL